MSAPKLRFKEFDGDWTNLKYKDVLTIKYGKDHKLLNDGDIPVYGTGGVMRYVDQYLYNGESILIGRKGTIDQPKYVNEKFWTVDTLFYSQIKENSIPLFLYQHALQVNWLGLNEATGVPSLNTTSINNVDIAIPSKEEQTKIASFLSAVDQKISQLSQKQQLLSQYKQGMMQKLFSQQIRFKADDGSEFGEWEEKLLSEIGTFKNGLNKDKESFGFGSPFINLMDVFGKKVVQTDKLGLVDVNQKDLENYDLIKGDVLFIRSSVKAEGVGQTALITDDLPNTVYSGFLIRFRDSYGLDLGFKKYCFMNNDFRLRLLAKSTTSANTNINQESLSALTINIPCLEEQSKIANFLSAIDQKIEVVAQQIEQAKTWKKGLLQQMFV